MDESACPQEPGTPPACPLGRALAKLDEVAPDAPILALGQTVFWDEPLKAGVLSGLRRLGSKRGFVAGVHDTDYFAKLPAAARKRSAKPGKRSLFQAVPHNDTSTKGLWSAAAEFSTLFGSETVLTREMLQQAGLRMSLLEQQNPGFLDEATEAWGWRGVVSLEDSAPITKDVRLGQVFEALHETLDWALDTALGSLSTASQSAASMARADIQAMLCDAVDDPTLSLSDLYQQILPRMYHALTGRHLDFETTRTTHLLRLNRETAGLPRFAITDHFFNQETRQDACDAYDAAILDSSLKHGGFYELARFGSGAIPFDLVIPGIGRGTIRLGRRGIVIMTPKPQFITLKKPLSGVHEFAALLEDKFGPDCTLIGKAVALIGMLAREFVFAFHEGASMYVQRSTLFHRNLKAKGLDVHANPILRIRYRTWDALSVACTWIKLPTLLQRPFGSEDLCAPSFARRWREVANEQASLLHHLGTLRRPIELIEFLDDRFGGSWHKIAEEYRSIHEVMLDRRAAIEEVRQERLSLYAERRAIRQRIREAEAASGDHFRAELFEKDAQEIQLTRRAELQKSVHEAHHALHVVQRDLKGRIREQSEVAEDPRWDAAIRRRVEIETEAELMRLRLIREAILASQGLANAERRPSAWWFPIVSPDGLWFRETVETADYRLEPLL